MNLRDIKELIKIVDASGLSEVHIEQDDVKLTLKKEVVVREINIVPRGEQIVREIVEENPLAVGEIKEDENLHVVKSPIVGIFYSASNPDSPSFVKLGDKVKVGQVLCIVEAMKLMNEITSEVEGEVVEILGQNQSPVEYGQPLFKIRKA